MTSWTRTQLISTAAAWMQARGWKGKLAKRREYEQSLLELNLMLTMKEYIEDITGYGITS